MCFSRLAFKITSLTHYVIVSMCPKETDSTFWQIQWDAINAGATAIQNCPGSTGYYGKIYMYIHLCTLATTIINTFMNRGM